MCLAYCGLIQQETAQALWKTFVESRLRREVIAVNERLVIVTATRDLPVNVQEFKQALGPGFSIEQVELPFGEMSLTTRHQYWERIRPAHGLFIRTGVIPYELIGQCPDLKVIALHGVGVDQVDVKAATEAGVYVTNVPGGNAIAVVELTLGLMISALRQIPKADALVRQGRWEEARTVGRELNGKRLGLVGFGNIAERVARVAVALGMEVVFWSRSRKNTDVGRQVELREVFETSDVVSIHIPLTADTTGFIGRRQLALMKPDSILVNTARGAVINKGDLLQALEERWIAGAALDVFHEEPLPANSPFRILDNVIMTPHMAGSTKECLTRLARVAGEDIRRVLSGADPLNAVNAPWTNLEP
jgi:phosphoglycerate dehydrogenase-like enzyme